MANNFNLRTFLTENKLTKNAQILKEEISFNGKPVNVGSVEIDGIDTEDYPDFVDAYIAAAEYEDGTPLTDEELVQFQEENYDLVSQMIHDNQLYLQEKKEDTMEEASSEDMAYTEKVEEALEESRLTVKERRLVEMVQDALGIAPQAVTEEGENVDYTMGRHDDPNQLPNPAPELNIPEGETNIEEAKPLPKYNSIEELMKEIEHGTNEAAHKYKMDEMKRVYEALEAKVNSLEEGEHAEHIDQKAVKQMRKDIATLRKAEEKLRKDFDKKFSGKEKKETPAKEKATEALQEGFDLRKFLAENRK
jgi:ribosomal protein L16 Arg81 hydroxylase